MKKRSSDEQKKPGEFAEDPLTEILRERDRKLLAHVVEDEVTGFLAEHTEVRDVRGAR